MSAIIDRMSRNSDFVWEAIMDNLPSNARRSRTNYVNFNCPMCYTRGESPDTKQRCGVSQRLDQTGQDAIHIACFNCGFRSGFTLGQQFSQRFKSFLSNIGMEELEVNRLNHRAFQLSRFMADAGITTISNPNRYIATFPKVELPQYTQYIHEIDSEDSDFIAAKDYANSRGEMISKIAMWTPDPKWRDRVLFPCWWREEIVGWTGRLINDQPDVPKYLNEVPANFLANCNVMTRDTRYILITEGFLDAIAIDGVSPFGAKLNANQITWIRETGREPIVIPDRDKSGQRLIDIALEQDWNVAFPRITRAGNNWWEEDCKDCAEAVNRYGRLYTLRSILETRTDRKLEIEIRRKWLY